MKKLTVTLEDMNALQKYQEAGVQEVVLAFEGHTFSALHEFSQQEILKITQEAHARGMQVIVLMNRLYAENDAAQAQEIMMVFLAAGMDFVMFQDPSLLKTAKENNLQSHLIYRPETLMTSTNDASFWMKQGLHSVVIPSLLTQDEIVEIVKNIQNTTVLIHGHMLMSVSKRKLVSSYRKAACRQFDVHSRNLSIQERQRDGLMPIYENAYACMIYSDYIQESFRQMQLFLKADAERFEIDTVFMEDEMIMDAIKIYRNILDKKDVSQQIETYCAKYSDCNLSDGYYGEKTIK